MSRVVWAMPLVLCLLNFRQVSHAADWPTFRHDNARSGYTAEAFEGRSVESAWVWRSAQPPAPAWPGPARWDSYANVRGLGSMRNYDPCFHVTVAGERAYFGSSVDDSVRAVDVASGEVAWTFTTDGPVRIAPTVAGEHLYFGSDDGRAYCVTASEGELVWRSERADDTDLILNNGRFVSLSPCRTGVLVQGDIAYFAQGMLPWRDTLLHAVDRLTGKVDGDGQYTKSHVARTLEGALLANDEYVIAPAGRVAPQVFGRADGEAGTALESSGGSSVVLTDDGHILCGPGNKTGWIAEVDLYTGKPLASHVGPVIAAFTPNGRVMVSRTRMTAYDASGAKKLWDIPCPHHNEVIVAGDTILLGGDDVVAAYALGDGTLLWEVPVEGRAFGLAYANQRLYVSTDEGVIHCFRPSDAEPTPLLVENTATGGRVSSEANGPDETGPTASEIRNQDRLGLLGHWVIHREMSAFARRRGATDGDRRVTDLTGTAHATIAGEIHVREVGGVEALELDGETNTLLISDDLKSAKLPRNAMTAEAWVRVDEADSAGAIIGCFEESDEVKEGWALGFHHQQFVFMFKTESDSKGFRYLRGETKIKPGHWYHVAATYNGETAKLTVNGNVEAETDKETGPLTYPEKGFFEIGAQHDSDSFHPMYGMLHEVRVYDRAATPDELTRRYEEKRDKFNVPIELATGPYARFDTPTTARIRWETATPMPSRLVLLDRGHARRFEDAQPKTAHELIIDELPRDRMLHYFIEKEVDGQVSNSLELELDTHFNFSSPTIPAGAQPFPEDERIAAAAKHMLGECGFDRGVCLVIGNGEGRLAWELVKQSDLRVIGIDTDTEKVASARQALLNAGVYGSHVAVHHVDSYDDLPFVGRIANLIVSERVLTDGDPVGEAEEMFRVLRPDGGVICLGRPTGDGSFDAAGVSQSISKTGLKPNTESADNGTWLTAVRPPLDGAGEWSHLYGRADNSAFGGEELSGASTTSEMNVQWIGRPGPRAQPDRNGRKPSPLSTSSRLFVQGLHRIIALDAFNGTVIWALEIPSLERFNMPRDCSNWCADEEFVYIAARDKCWQIDAATGEIAVFHPVVDGSREDWSYDWGFIAQEGDLLLGSAVKAGTAFTSFWGDAGAGWYDARSGPATFKVCSDGLFAKHKADGSDAWSYQEGVIINSSITVAADHVYFVECRHPQVKQSQARRVGSDELWEQQFLVALNLQSGEKVWEQPLDTADGKVAFYLAAGADALVINASTNNQFEVSTYEATDGTHRWTQTFDWFEKKGDHGKAIQRPAIVGGMVYVKPKVMELATGEIQSLEMPKGKCGTYAATTQSLIFRTTEITMWNTLSGSMSSWDRMRPGCWLSTIPASGMILSPEGGGGCSCGSWMEMSVGFMPDGDE